MLHIKEIILNGLCTCCSAQETREMKISGVSGSDSWIKISVGGEEIEVHGIELIRAIRTMID